VVTENSVRSENAEVPIIREIMVATTMSSLFVALFALAASSFRTRAAPQAEILALRHQLRIPYSPFSTAAVLVYERRILEGVGHCPPKEGPRPFVKGIEDLMAAAKKV